MPMYTYRREDGSTFDIRQKFLDDPLTICPTTGQGVVRVVQNAGVIFKGSGFYVNDSKNASKKNLSASAPAKETSDSAASATTGSTSGTNNAGGTSAAAPAGD